MSILGLNAAASLAGSLLGVRSDPYLNFNFLVEVEGLIVGGFSEVSGLQVETEVQEYREGGLNEYMHKLAGPTRYPTNLILKRGLSDIQTLWAWHQDVTHGIIKRRNGTIFLLGSDRLPAIWWNFTEAYPIKWVGPDLRGDSNTVAVESVELVHRGLSRPDVGGLEATVSGTLSAQVNVSISL